MRFIFQIIFLVIISIALPADTCMAKANVDKYGVVLTVTSQEQQAALKHSMDSVFARHSMLNSKTVLSAIDKPHIMIDKTMDFYFLLIVCLLLGIVRYADPRYFVNLWRVFINPGQSTASKEQMEVSALSNIVMNVFFVVTAGAYAYYFVNINSHKVPAGLNKSYLVLILIGGIGFIYLVKYLALRFSGWAFRIQHITEYYIFNVFLMNKIMAVALLPLVVLMAFGGPKLYGPAIMLSGIVIIGLFLNRYIRSWRTFGSFFQYSRFHFFTYLCASEILPLAVLMKLLVSGLW